MVVTLVLLGLYITVGSFAYGLYVRIKGVRPDLLCYALYNVFFFLSIIACFYLIQSFDEESWDEFIGLLACSAIGIFAFVQLSKRIPARKAPV